VVADFKKIMQEDKRFMQVAVKQAEIAEENGDVPIGSV